jgi:4-diphosphocytidyl-2-C-methyl-D-erythritol kinase
MPVVRLAPAKLNLTLAVLGRRADGFHDLHSVMVPLALADRLSLAASPTGTDTIHVEGFDAGPDGDNLVLRAIAATRRRVTPSWPGPDREPVALAARLEKRIPVAAGLAGGSSDAAAAIDASLEAWSATLEPDERLAVAAELGSDVPFFLGNAAAAVTGRGEKVRSLIGIRGESPGILLVCPRVAMATPAVFAAFDAGHGPPLQGVTPASSRHLAEELRGGLSRDELLVRAGVLSVANDLIVASEAVAPGLVAFRRALSRVLGRPVGQSGSGPTCWALYASEAEASAAVDVVADAIATGRLPSLGDGAPFVSATTIPPEARPALDDKESV